MMMMVMISGGHDNVDDADDNACYDSMTDMMVVVVVMTVTVMTMTVMLTTMTRLIMMMMTTVCPRP